MKQPPAPSLPRPHVPTIKDKEKQHARFLDIFKHVHINIPFFKSLEKMPKYAIYEGNIDKEYKIQ